MHVKQLPCWRDFDAEDTVRFYALRLHEAGMIKSTPSKIIAQGTDWRFFNETQVHIHRQLDILDIGEPLGPQQLFGPPGGTPRS